MMCIKNIHTSTTPTDNFGEALCEKLILFCCLCTKRSPVCPLRAAAMTLRTVLLSLQALLAAAEPDDPQDAVVANQVGVRVFMFDKITVDMYL